MMAGEFIKERLMAIFIGLVMLLAVGGWAVMSIVPQDTGPEFNVPIIVTRELTSDEIIYVLQTGRVLIEYFYTTNTTDYLDDLPILESFTSNFNNFVVLEEVAGNQTRFEMIGINGQILNVEDLELNYDNLLDTFCTIAIAQPPECLL